ncbi:histidine phosphatase family protein [Algivirga pacifica]|uniref:phosphoglycerate mutase (2,3-diphosphoglycerate-dependent) n=1 Tax=Algivirga pacifica TaxID=1162670 RepID=A0ABP9DLR5_9BACT
MKKYVYIVRHGQTELNKRGWVQGSGVDAHLNNIGQQQALAFYESFKHVPFDKVYTSKLIRTQQSVANFIGVGIPHQTLWGLNEISWGDKEGRPLTPEDDRQHFAMVKAWRAGKYDERSPGGESPAEVAYRQQLAWQYIMSHDHEENILICMHGRAIRILLCQLMQVPLSEMDRFKHSNLGLYKLHFNGLHYEIELENDVNHLEPLIIGG